MCHRFKSYSRQISKKFMNYLIKPFSPHLLIYNIQISSVSSILHRISSIFLLFSFLIYLLIYFLCLNIFLYDYLIFCKLIFLLFSFLIYFLLKISLFHILNGLKIVLWHLNYLKEKNFLNKISNLVFVLFILMCLA